MPLRDRTDLWCNLPGVVAAYQPVRASGPLLARYNMAYGGDNRYRAEPGVLPTWSAVTGWGFDGTSQWLKTNIQLLSSYTTIIRITTVLSPGSSEYALGIIETAPSIVAYQLLLEGANSIKFANPNTVQVATSGVGVLAIAGSIAYKNGLNVGDLNATWAYNPTPAGGCLIGSRNYRGTPNGYAEIVCPAFAIYARTLSPAEVWAVSRQMAYCDVNPDWSVWGRRRQWYYGPQVAAGAVGIYGKRGAVALPGGVRIEAVQ